jgi:hypothetical protein
MYWYLILRFLLNCIRLSFGPSVKGLELSPSLFLYSELSYKLCYLKLYFNLWFLNTGINTYWDRQLSAVYLKTQCVPQITSLSVERRLSKQSSWKHVDRTSCGRIRVIPHVCLERLRKPWKYSPKLYWGPRFEPADSKTNSESILLEMKLFCC